MKNELDIRLRKQKGKARLPFFHAHVVGFQKPVWIDIGESDQIISKLKKYFVNKQELNELVDKNQNFIESDLLRNTYNLLSKSSRAYLFTNDFDLCGIYDVLAKEAIENAFEISKNDFNQTCFIASMNEGFYFRINYYDSDHNDYPDKFDIKKVISNSF